MLHSCGVAAFGVGVHIGQFPIESAELANAQIQDCQHLDGTEQFTCIIYSFHGEGVFTAATTMPGSKTRKSLSGAMGRDTKLQMYT